MTLSPTLISTLAGMPTVHALIRSMRLQQAASVILDRRPLVLRTRRHGLRYRMRYLESVMVADEIFNRGVYASAFAGRTVETFVDLGTNVGYFLCDAVDRTGKRDIIGLAVDANPTVVEEARWHVHTNGLSGIRVVHGLVGHPPDVREAPLYMSGSNVSASAQPNFNPLVPTKGEITSSIMPCVDVLAEWRAMAGDRRVDLLKIDIEGFELTALENLAGLLAITDAVVIEWHNWITSRAKVEEVFGRHGFVLDVLVSEDEDAGIGVFRRR
jgi:FkbM family methyltransferase